MKTTYRLEVICYASQEVLIDESISKTKFNSIKNRLDRYYYDSEEAYEETLNTLTTTIEYAVYDTQIILTKVESK